MFGTVLGMFMRLVRKWHIGATDLISAPWVAACAAWTHGNDYTETHAVANAARGRDVQWICYESVRAAGKRCAAVLDVEALEIVGLEKTKQTWHCKCFARVSHAGQRP